jgi:hypothetical protein
MNFNGISSLAGINAGASDAELNSLETGLGVTLPTAYRELMRFSNGALLDSGVSIYSVGDVAERNATYEVLEYCPGFLLVGDDSGGRGFLIDTNDNAGRVYGSGLGDLDPSEFVTIASTLQDWVDKGLGV